MESQHIGAKNIPGDESQNMVLSCDHYEYDDDPTDEEWSAFSLAQACAELEEDGPIYSVDDLIEVYSYLPSGNK